MITTLLIILHVAVCLVLIVVILVQGGRGQGLSGPSFSSGNVQSLLGTQAADFLTKATTVSAICFLFTCIILNVVETRKSKSLLEGIQQNAPVDLDAVKKALEKVKAEQTSASSEEAKNAVADLTKKVETAADTAVTQAVKTAETTVNQAAATADNAPAAVANTANQAVTDAAKTADQAAA